MNQRFQPMLPLAIWLFAVVVIPAKTGIQFFHRESGFPLLQE